MATKARRHSDIMLDAEDPRPFEALHAVKPSWETKQRRRTPSTSTPATSVSERKTRAVGDAFMDLTQFAMVMAVTLPVLGECLRSRSSP